MAVFALLPALTALFGSCALYGLLGINTRSSTQHPHA
ncbi:MAG: YgaP-like transmembrane domain [Cyanobacteria bacterium P01_G01_bin.38]